MKYFKYCLLIIAFINISSCTKIQNNNDLKSIYPVAIDLSRVGSYDALVKSGGGFYYDEVLEYRVWLHKDGEDEYKAFAFYEKAKEYSEKQKNAEPPLVLVLQKEYINEPQPNIFEHIKEERIAEWCVEWLKDHKRGPDSINTFLMKKK